MVPCARHLTVIMVPEQPMNTVWAEKNIYGILAHLKKLR